MLNPDEEEGDDKTIVLNPSNENRADETLEDKSPSKTEKSREAVENVEKKPEGGQENEDEKKNKENASATHFATKNQELFLIEFLVDCVSIDACAVDQEILDGQTCLSLSFLNFPPMEICEKNYGNRKNGSEKIKFNCGKSLMFAFNEYQCDHPPVLTLEMTVSKKLHNSLSGGAPYKVDIGTIKICVSELFRQITDIAKLTPDRLPASKSIKDCFMLIGPGKRTMGEVSIYIRFSCLGQNIITEFQCGSDIKSNPVLFKNREGKKVFEFKGRDVGDDDPNGAKSSLNPNKGRIGCGCIKMNTDQSHTTPRGGQGKQL